MSHVYGARSMSQMRGDRGDGCKRWICRLIQLHSKGEKRGVVNRKEGSNPGECVETPRAECR